MKRAIFLLMVVPLLAACGVYRPLQIAPAKKGATVVPRFSEAYYYFDRDRDAYFVMRSKGDAGASDGVPVEQVMTVRVFWLPKGGVTTLNPTAVNATFRYMVMTPTAIGMYEGAGFVRMNSDLGSRQFDARVMGGDLRLTQASASFVDALGRGQIQGVFKATYDDAKATEMLREVEEEFFARSLKDMPATKPATPGAASMPASAPASAPASGAGGE
jgi:predicted small lipoprotein YifL